ncbi:3933_t:CDS:2, partial [Entrophospora sp. SA101]
MKSSWNVNHNAIPIIKESVSDDNEDELLDANEEDLDVFEEGTDISDLLEFIFVNHTIHPTDDPIAKWSLCSIFNDNLESPDF